MTAVFFFLKYPEIIKDQENVMERWESGETADKKQLKPRLCPNAQINQKVWDFMCDARARNIPVSGKLLQEQAMLYSLEMGLDNFSASNGWLDRWKKRYQVSCSTLCGESGGVDEDLCKTWKERIPQVLEGYDLKNVFNADETGLFSRALPSKSMVQKEASVSGVKINKNRVTALVATSAIGEKLRPLIIGKSEKPRCFQHLSVRGLGIDYYHNKKAWMTRDIFADWMKKLNNKMRSQDRKILMFLDNCSAHPPLQLSHIKIIMLPPNTTSKLQPCDAGIIQAVKLNYRKRLLRHVLHKMGADKTATGPELASSINLLDAVMWWKLSWDLLSAETIVKCFAMCGFGLTQHPQIAPDVEEEDEEFGPLLPPGISLENFANFDETEQATFDHEETDQPEPAAEEAEEEDAEGEAPSSPVINCFTAAAYARELIRYGLANDLPDLAQTMSKVQADIVLALTKKSKQTTITSFFKK